MHSLVFSHFLSSGGPEEVAVLVHGISGLGGKVGAVLASRSLVEAIGLGKKKKNNEPHVNKKKKKKKIP